MELSITFQKYDSDWNEFIDLEADAELEHKDKVKAVVTATQVAPTMEPEGTATEVREQVKIDGRTQY